MSDPFDVTTALTEAASAFYRPQSVEKALDAIVFAARSSVPGFDEVGISLMHSNGEVKTQAATGDLVWALDGLQYYLGEGPTVSSLREDTVIIVDHLRSAHRWPRYVPAALDGGVKSLMALRLYVDEHGTIGGITFYSTSQECIDPQAPQLAEVFAAQAAVTLGHAHGVQHLNQGLEARQQIGQAVGVLIERYRVDEHAAISFLVRLSSQTNSKIRDVAAAVVTDALDRFTSGQQPNTVDGDREPSRADLKTTMSWSSNDQADVERAILVAMDALDQRNAGCDDLLKEAAALFDFIDPHRLRARMASDRQAKSVLRTLLADPDDTAL